MPGGDRGRLRGEGIAPAGDDLGHHHRQERPDSVRANARRLLQIDRARPAALGRAQLRGRRHASPAVHGRAGEPGRLPRQLLPECRAAQHHGWLRRKPGSDLAPDSRDGDRRTAQHRRWLLWHYAGPHPRHRAGGGRDRAATAAAEEAEQRAQARGPRHPDRALRFELHHDRRAHQRLGLEEVRQPDQGGRLRGRAGHRPRSGARRRQHPRRQHGRGAARRREGDDDLPEPGGQRAGDRAPAHHGRQLEVVRDRGGAQVPARQGHRQFAFPQGRRGRIPRQGPPGASLRRRGGGHGLRRARPGGHRAAASRDRPAGLPPAGRQGRLRPERHHHRSERARHRHRHGGAQRLRQGLHRGHPAHQGGLPGYPHLRRHLEPVVLVPRQRSGARGDAHGVPLPRDRGGPRPGDRQRRTARRLRRPSRRAARAGRGRHPEPTPGRHRAPAGNRRTGQGRGQETRGGSRLAGRARREAPGARPGPRHHRLHRRRRRGSAAEAGQAARRHRGAAHGRAWAWWAISSARARCSCPKW